MGSTGVWDVVGGNCEVMQGSGHSNQVQDMKIVGDSLVTVGMDDCLIISSASSKQYGYVLLHRSLRIYGQITVVHVRSRLTKPHLTLPCFHGLFAFTRSSIKLPSQPRRFDATENGLCVVACINHVRESFHHRIFVRTFLLQNANKDVVCFASGRLSLFVMAASYRRKVSTGSRRQPQSTQHKHKSPSAAR